MVMLLPIDGLITGASGRKGKGEKSDQWSVISKQWSVAGMLLKKPLNK
jgi:hypothetical protein